MKKIFFFLVLFLLPSYWVADILAQGSADVYPIEYSDAGGAGADHQYYIGVTRSGKYWTLDHAVSSAVYQRAQLDDSNDLNQRWRFVLVGSDESEFYIQNVGTGEYVSYYVYTAPSVEGETGQITDSYGKLLPGDDIRDPRVTGTLQSHYYADQGVDPVKFQLLWNDSQKAWVLADYTNGTGGNGPNDHGNWGSNAIFMSLYNFDAGNAAFYEVAGIPAINVGATSLSIGSLPNKKTDAYLTVTGRFLEEDLSISFEGPDAACFSQNAPAGFKKGTLTIGFTPNESQVDYSATLVLKSSGIETKVSLIGKAYPETGLPKISSEDDSEEYWYFIQFAARMTENKAWTSHGGNGQVTQEIIPAGEPEDSQLWKVVGDWENGFVFVNKATGGELKYNQNVDQTPIITGFEYGTGEVPASIAQNGTDTYFVYGAGGGYGDLFNFIRATTGWRLFNRDINSSPINATQLPDGYDGRYIYDREGFWVRQAGASSTANDIVFTERKPFMTTNLGATLFMKALAGETAETTVSVTGIGTTEAIKATITGSGSDAFSIDVNSLPASGGNLIITFTPEGNDSFYLATLTLSSDGATDLIIPLTGSDGSPIMSGTDDIWHYIQFVRSIPDGKVWQSNGIGSETAVRISQVAREENNYYQQWRFIGTKDGFIIENRMGGYLYVAKPDPSGYYGLTDDEELASTLELRNYTNQTVNNIVLPYSFGFQDLTIDNGVNDNGRSYVCPYSASDNGSQIWSIPVEYVVVGRKMIIPASTKPFLMTAAGQTTTVTIDISSVGITGGTIAAVVAGEGFTINTTSIPGAGGELTITFAPTEANKDYSGTVTLSNPEVEKDVEITVTGKTPPAFSTEANEVWYYIQFERQNNADFTLGVWQGYGIDGDVTQEEAVKDEPGQHWKLVGNWDGTFKIVNREGGEIAFLGTQADGDEAGKVGGFASLVSEGSGDPMAFVPESNKWALWLYDYFFDEDPWGCVNDFAGSGTDVGIWYTDDGGDYIIFTPIDKIDTGIENPAIDSNGQVIATRYYTIQGVEVKAPTTTGIYIVKNLYSSGKTQAVKQLILVK